MVGKVFVFVFNKLLESLSSKKSFVVRTRRKSAYRKVQKMSYDPKHDKEIKTWRIPVTDNEVAVVSLKSYDGGDPKLAIGPLEIDQDGKIIHSRIKRWSWSELLKLREVLDQAIEKMDSLAAKGRK